MKTRVGKRYTLTLQVHACKTRAAILCVMRMFSPYNTALLIFRMMCFEVWAKCYREGHLSIPTFQQIHAHLILQFDK